MKAGDAPYYVGTLLQRGYCLDLCLPQALTSSLHNQCAPAQHAVLAGKEVPGVLATELHYSSRAQTLWR